jgi:sigma-B regulation protein RsbQ
VADLLARNNVTCLGPAGGPAMVFAHGFGCDQHVWRHVAPHFADDHRVVLFDHVGAGGSDLGAYDEQRYGTLDGYADDLLELWRELDLGPMTFVGHSVSATIGILAACREPAAFERLVLIGPSPRFVDDGDYTGGYSEQDIAELLDALDHNYLGWAGAVAPMIMGTPDRPELGQELTENFCRTDPVIAEHFARVAFLADHREALGNVTTPTVILHCAQDALVPDAVAEYVHRHIDGSRLVHLDATGHCPHLSAPQETVDAIKATL